jgi:hypothetical protein
VLLEAYLDRHSARLRGLAHSARVIRNGYPSEGVHAAADKHDNGGSSMFRNVVSMFVVSQDNLVVI